MNSPASMYECSDPQFFDEPRLVLTFLTYLGVTEIARSSRLVLEGKAGKKIPESSKLEFLEKFLANNFALSDAKDNTLEPLNTWGIADLHLLRSLLAIPQIPRAKFLGSDRLFY